MIRFVEINSRQALPDQRLVHARPIGEPLTQHSVGPVQLFFDVAAVIDERRCARRRHFAYPPPERIVGHRRRRQARQPVLKILRVCRRAAAIDLAGQVAIRVIGVGHPLPRQHLIRAVKVYDEPG